MERRGTVRLGGIGAAAVASVLALGGGGRGATAATPPAAAATEAPVIVPPTAGRTIVAPLSGEVDLGVAAYLRRVIRDAGPDDLVILDIDTFGGRIDAAVQV